LVTARQHAAELQHESADGANRALPHQPGSPIIAPAPERCPIPLGNLQNGRAKPVKPLADAWRIGAGCGHGTILLWNGRTRCRSRPTPRCRASKRAAGPRSAWRAGGGRLARSICGPRGVAGVRVLLDTNVLSEPLRERSDPAVMAELEDGTHALHTASVVLHELSLASIASRPGGYKVFA
jgi:hypothetical protein